MPSYIREDPPSAEWMKREELLSGEFDYEAGRILLGRTKSGATIGIDDPRHVMTIAGSRAGKSVTSLLPNLMTWRGSAVVIDPKGELATSSAHIRAQQGHDVVILDPFEEVKGEAAQYRRGFNPMTELLAYGEDAAIDEAAMMAEALIVSTKNDGSDHWTLSAKNLLRGLLLNGLDIQMKAGHPISLKDIREFISWPYESDDSEVDTLSEMLDLMAKNPSFEGAIAASGGTVLGKPDNERGSIISTATEQTSFLDSEKMKSHLSAENTFSLADLKKRPTTLYLVLPASRMVTHFRWFRMILTMALNTMERVENETDDPVLFVLEEFASLGHMRQIEMAAGLMAGYGVKLWTVLQDLSQLKTHYPNSWETFIGNAGVVEAFGNVDQTTLDYLSKMMGQSLAVQTQPQERGRMGQMQGDATERDTIISAPLMAPHEIALRFERTQHNKLILIGGRPPFALGRIFWKELL